MEEIKDSILWQKILTYIAVVSTSLVAYFGSNVIDDANERLQLLERRSEQSSREIAALDAKIGMMMAHIQQIDTEIAQQAIINAKQP